MQSMWSTHSLVQRPECIYVTGNSALIIGMNLGAHCNTFNRNNLNFISLKRTTNKEERVLFTYLVPSDSRLRLSLAPHSRSRVGALVGNARTTVKRMPLALCKVLQRYIHASGADMKSLWSDARSLNLEMKKLSKQYAMLVKYVPKMESRKRCGLSQ